MDSSPPLKIKGISGHEYIFPVYRMPHPNFKAEGGVYIFTELQGNGGHRHIYLGITNDLSERFDNHHKIDCISNNGATHLSAFLESSEDERKRIEKDILAAITTTCNEQLN